MNLQEIQEYLEQNKDQEEVKAFLEKLSTPTVESVKGFLENTEEGKKLLQSLTDSKVTKGIESWKKNNLQKLIDEEIAKRYPPETEEQRQLRELKEKIQQMEQEKLREALKNKALTIATEKKLPLALIDYFIGSDEESTLNNLQRLEEVWSKSLQTLVEEKLRSSGTNPKDGQPPQTLTRDQILNMNPDDINKNWDVIKKMLSHQ